MNEIKVFRVQVKIPGATIIVKTMDEMERVFSESKVRDMIFIRVIEMTQSEIDELPEFTGF